MYLHIYMFTYFDIYIYTYMYTYIYTVYALSHIFTRLGTHDRWILVDTVLGGFIRIFPYCSHDSFEDSFIQDALVNIFNQILLGHHGHLA